MSLHGVPIGTWTPGSPEWHQARSGRVGASEIGTVMRWNDWETRSELLARKRGVLPPREATKATDRGKYLEPSIAAWFADQTGAEYTAGSDSTYVHPEHSWASCNPDRILADDTLLEIKTAKEKTVEHGWGRAGTDAIPLTYQAQCQWAMFVMGATLCHVAVLFGAPFDFYSYRVKYDPDVCRVLVSEGERFIHELDQGIAA